jgi:hypothetical protein
MKKIALMIMASALFAISCDLNLNTPKTAEITISLTSEGEPFKKADITVIVKDNNSSASYKAKTDEEGVSVFTLPSGLYSASASYRENTTTVHNGLNSNISVSAGTDASFEVEMKPSKVSQLIIKEIYVGGCMQDDGIQTFGNDGYMILYNNTDITADASDVCFAFASPSNSNAKNNYMVDGRLSYESEGWIPAGYAIWWFTSTVEIPPYSQIVIAMKGAVNHTQTHSNSVDLSKGEYYCMYDPEAGYDNAKTYPAPSAAIPSSHYLKTYRYGLGNAWAYSQISPAFYILKQTNVGDFTKNTENYDYTENPKLPNAKVPVEWILDGVEIYTTTSDKNDKRLTSEIDNGYVMFTNKLGYSVYRNVDQEATEAIEGNKEKLVYNYSMGTVDVEGSTDPSGIDAEASIKNGAIIIYKDTNNSTNDFHQRRQASIK